MWYTVAQALELLMLLLRCHVVHCQALYRVAANSCKTTNVCRSLLTYYAAASVANRVCITTYVKLSSLHFVVANEVLVCITPSIKP